MARYGITGNAVQMGANSRERMFLPQGVKKKSKGLPAGMAFVHPCFFLARWHDAPISRLCALPFARFPFGYASDITWYGCERN